MSDDVRQPLSDIQSETAAAVERLIELRRDIDITITQSREMLATTRDAIVRAQGALARADTVMKGGDGRE